MMKLKQEKNNDLNSAIEVVEKIIREASNKLSYSLGDLARNEKTCRMSEILLKIAKRDKELYTILENYGTLSQIGQYLSNDERELIRQIFQRLENSKDNDFETYRKMLGGLKVEIGEENHLKIDLDGHLEILKLASWEIVTPGTIQKRRIEAEEMMKSNSRRMDELFAITAPISELFKYHNTHFGEGLVQFRKLKESRDPSLWSMLCRY